MKSSSKPQFEEHFHSTLSSIIKQNAVIETAYKIGLWTNFYSNPVYAEILNRFDLQRGEYVVLVCLAGGHRMNAKEICDVTGRPKNSISRAVNRLCEMNLAKRESHSSDGRKAVLSITPAGQTLYEAIMPLFAARQNMMLDALTARERQQLGRLFDKLVAHSHRWVGPMDRGEEEEEEKSSKVDE